MQAILKALGAVGKLVGKAFGLASKAGLTDKTVQDALVFVKLAAVKLVDNAERREWVVKMLTSKGVPENVARIATELAVRLFKDSVS